MFQDGVKKTISSEPAGLATTRQGIHTPKRCYLPRRRLPQSHRALATTETQTNAPRGRGEAELSDTGFLRFPFSNFRHSLTLFSKFFASFPHGTCSLSISRRYLALDGVYHPLRAAIPSNSTRMRYTLKPRPKAIRGSHPHRHPVPRDLS